MKTRFLTTMKMTALGAVAATGVFFAPAAEASENSRPLYLSYAWIPASADGTAAAAMSPAQKRKLAAQLSYQGNGSYICSPSGSGSKPRCFTRR